MLSFASRPLLQLPDVTLCCVDTRSVQQSFYALRHCLQHAQFGRAVFLGPNPDALLPHERKAPEGVEWIPIQTLTGIGDYSRFVLSDLVKHVRTSHALIVQWDGFITHPHLWQDDYLSWDYIGAPWYHGGHPGMVGNGGFSLRSRKLLEALRKVSIDSSLPEDEEICVRLRPQLERDHGIRFAPLEVAKFFSHEYGPFQPAFGFHGMHDFAHVMTSQQLCEWLELAPEILLHNKHARKLIKELIWARRGAEARRLIRRRTTSAGWTLDDVSLIIRSVLPSKSTHHV